MKMWSQAKEMSAQTPAERNRYVDFLRAVSILMVVSGHWLIVGIYFADGSINFSKLLVIRPNTQWMTWGFSGDADFLYCRWLRQCGLA